MTRFELWDAVAAAVRASFPDRAAEILRAIERRIEPGPWSVAVGPSSGIASRDRAMTDVARALRAADGETADESLRALEQWMRDAALAGGRARLGLRSIVSDWGACTVDWAADALEAGLDTPSLRILAGTSTRLHREVEDALLLAMRELAVDRDPRRELRDAALWLARECVQQRLDPHVAARRLYDLAHSDEGEAGLEVWQEYDFSNTGHAVTRGAESFRQQILAAARAFLGAPES